ncbi:AraC family transcriptional regulator [Paenibacillus sp. J31TS4]|uniref:AraC family transcriptional regulator n=1 Tax=Paenibacillus sp. J31TS4 TaxID=2807195 RepID=UPI001B24A6D8|nr:AraC family transcriptional regulator [Paenibacillus sp. J31TS4]GIP40578.1 AraC family transcriptional regulator [Paenibacillus sp. J31TS4]
MKTHASDRIKMPLGFWASLRPLGIAAHDVARRARLPLTIVQEPVVTTAQYFAIWQAYADLIGEPALGIVQLVNAFEPAQYPPPVLATYHARDYRDALYRTARYKTLCPPESLRIHEEGEHCIIEMEWMHTEQPGPPILAGITLAFLVELGRRGTGQPVTPQSVEFMHRIGDAQVLEAYFGCPIRLEAPHNRLTLDRRDLDRAFVSYNEELLEILTPALDQSLDGHLRNRSMKETVLWILKRSLSGGCPDIHAVAKELGMSDRTLQRRLTDESTSFKSLLTQARQEQARAYLADASLDIKEVAFLLGYEDQNSFYRAFRMWEGETPTNWRHQYGETTSH